MKERPHEWAQNLTNRICHLCLLSGVLRIVRLRVDVHVEHYLVLHSLRVLHNLCDGILWCFLVIKATFLSVARWDPLQYRNLGHERRHD